MPELPQALYQLLAACHPPAAQLHLALEPCKFGEEVLRRRGEWVRVAPRWQGSKQPGKQVPPVWAMGAGQPPCLRTSSEGLSSASAHDPTAPFSAALQASPLPPPST